MDNNEKFLVVFLSVVAFLLLFFVVFRLYLLIGIGLVIVATISVVAYLYTWAKKKII